MLMIHLVYQRVANAADAPLSVAPQGGGVNPRGKSFGNDLLFILQKAHQLVFNQLVDKYSAFG
jgi:hypothetical protein